MTFIALVFKNIWRVRARTILTIVGISLGVATIVVFSLLTAGMHDVITNMFRPGTADFTVVRAGSADIVLSFLSDDQVARIAQTPGVARSASLVVALVPLDRNPFFLMNGVDGDKLDMLGAQMREGRVHVADDEVIIGQLTARNRNLSLGDVMEISDKAYTVVGIYESGVSFMNAGATVTIAQAQRMQGVQDQVNMVSVVVEEGEDIREVAGRIEDADPNLATIIDPSDYDAVEQGAQIATAFSWAISLLAVVIGGVGVMNTIVMSVFERTREIGVLRALGWRRRRIAAMVMAEACVMGVLAAPIGMALGVGALLLLRLTELGQAYLVVEYTPFVFLQALAVSIAVVFLGSLYPALKASRMLPIEALRYE